MKNLIWIKIAVLLWVVSGIMIFGFKRLPASWKTSLYYDAKNKT